MELIASGFRSGVIFFGSVLGFAAMLVATVVAYKMISGFVLALIGWNDDTDDPDDPEEDDNE